MPNLSSRFPGASAIVVVFYCQLLHFSGSVFCFFFTWTESHEITNAIWFLHFLDIRLLSNKIQENKIVFFFKTHWTYFFVIFILAILFNMTLDADRYSSRVTSRGIFKENSERFLILDVQQLPTMQYVQLYVSLTQHFAPLLCQSLSLVLQTSLSSKLSASFHAACQGGGWQ